MLHHINNNEFYKILLVPYIILWTIRHTFFFEKIASKINIKSPVSDLKFPPVLKMATYSMPWETYLYLATLDSSGSSSALMLRTWVWGFTSLLTMSPSHPAITNPEQCLAYDVSLQSTVPVNLNWKWFVLSVTVQYFC